jgi:uncharacterized protein (TIGR00369 family)
MLAPNADRFAPLPPDRAARWADFPGTAAVYFPGFVGLRLEEVRTDYARMRLPFRAELNQPAGVVHGGAVATLVDTVVVPAIGSAWDEPRRLLTIDMQLQYLDALVEEDAVGEGWVVKRGRSTVFCRAEVFGASGRLVAAGTLVYKVSAPRA